MERTPEERSLIKKQSAERRREIERLKVLGNMGSKNPTKEERMNRLKLAAVETVEHYGSIIERLAKE